MAIITFSESLRVGKFRFGQQRKDISYSSPFGSQSVGAGGPLWIATIAQPNELEMDSGYWQALALKLAGKTNQLELWNLKRPEPVGTLRGTLTFNGAHAQNATSLLISGGVGQAHATVMAGDYFGMGSGVTQQVVMALDDAVADAAGDIVINIAQTPLRNAFGAGAAITWNKPKALFRQTVTRHEWEYGRGNVVTGITLDLIESFNP